MESSIQGPLQSQRPTEDDETITCAKCRGLIEFMGNEFKLHDNVQDFGRFSNNRLPSRGRQPGQRPNRYELNRNLEPDCVLCHLIFDQLLPNDRDGKFGMGAWGRGLNVVCETNGKGQMSLRFEDASGLTNKYIHVSLVPLDQSSRMAEHRHEANTNSETSWRIAQRWLDTCIATHSCASNVESRLPTRLIQISHSIDGIKLRLVESKNVPHGTNYCTLSHCWGRIPNMWTLRKSNYEGSLKNIPLNWLTKTFQHAIIAATKLNFSYIWIDSLCIIQQDKDDWQQEAATMATVYALSSLNLAATSGTDGHAGLFFTRNPKIMKPLKVFWPSVGNYLLTNPFLWVRNVEESPLASRAWVLQERFLAPRTLHFTTNQLFWECTEGCACEMFPTVEAPKIYEDESYLINSLKGPMTGEMLWDNIVRTYSQTYLSHSGDKLVALSGIARTVHRKTGGAYLAGMWTSGLEDQLLWSVKKAKLGQPSTGSLKRIPKPQRSEVYRAPSWSWTAIDGFIVTAKQRLSADPHKSMIEILEARLEHVVRGDEFGQIKSGYLRIGCGQLKRTQIRRSWNGSFNICVSVRGKFRDLKYVLDVEPLNGTENIYLLLVRKTSHISSTPISKYEYDTLDGLLLTEASQPEGYRRLGTFSISGYWGSGFLGKLKGQGIKNLDDFLSLPGVEDSEAYDSVPGPEPKEVARYMITLH